MALTIGPAGRGADRRRDLMLHGLGLAVGSMTMAIVLTGVGIAVRHSYEEVAVWLGWLLSVLAVLWLVFVLTGRRTPSRLSRWQVPAHWRHTYPPGFTAVAYGFLLGLGALTDVLTPAFWALAVATVALADLPLALAAWLVLGAVRLWFTARWTLVVAEAVSCGIDPPHDLGSRSVLSFTRLAAAGATLGLALMSIT